LYRQAPLRSLMAVELLALLRAPAHARRHLRALGRYSAAQEELREQGFRGSIAARQLSSAAERAGLSVAQVEQLVHEWMVTRPLKYLRWCRATGLGELLDFLAARDVRTGVLSDYPAESKLTALGLQDRFWPVLCSTAPEIGALKPHPAGFLRASALWNLRPSEILVVGDRIDVDAAGASAAGMRCVIVGARKSAASANFLALPSFERLRHVLESCC
jgi:putative hydrolase of the HAD superfamily